MYMCITPVPTCSVPGQEASGWSASKQTARDAGTGRFYAYMYITMYMHVYYTCICVSLSAGGGGSSCGRLWCCSCRVVCCVVLAVCVCGLFLFLHLFRPARYPSAQFQAKQRVAGVPLCKRRATLALDDSTYICT